MVRTSPSFTPTVPDSILLTFPWVHPSTAATSCCVIPAPLRACRSSLPSCLRREVTVLAITAPLPARHRPNHERLVHTNAQRTYIIAYDRITPATEIESDMRNRTCPHGGQIG